MGNRTFAVLLFLVSCGSAPLYAQAGDGPGAGASGWAVSPEPVLRIGGSPADPDQQLFRVLDALRLGGGDGGEGGGEEGGDGGDGGEGGGGGSIVVANQGTHEVRFYGLDGSFQHAFGREGDGPGEFRRIHRIGPLGGDSLYVFDNAQQRLSVFTAAGELARDQRVPGSRARAVATDLVRVGESRWIAVELEATGGPSPGEMHRERFHLTARGPSLETTAEIGEIPGRISGGISVNGRAGFRQVLFTPAPLYDAHGRCLAATSGDDPGVRILLPDGGVVREMSVGRPPVSITDDHIDAVVEWVLESRDQPIPPQEEQAVREGLEALVLRDHLPLHHQLVVDALGYVWLQEYDVPLRLGTRWTVLGPGGEVARLELPVPLQVHEVGRDWILGTWTDALGDPRIHMYRLQRGEGGTAPALPECAESSAR